MKLYEWQKVVAFANDHRTQLRQQISTHFLIRLIKSVVLSFRLSQENITIVLPFDIDGSSIVTLLFLDFGGSAMNIEFRVIKYEIAWMRKTYLKKFLWQAKKSSERDCTNLYIAI